MVFKRTDASLRYPHPMHLAHNQPSELVRLRDFLAQRGDVELAIGCRGKGATPP